MNRFGICIALVVICLGFFSGCGSDSGGKSDDTTAVVDLRAEDVKAETGLPDAGPEVRVDVPVETAAEIVAAYDPFKVESAWAAFDAGKTGGLKTEGYFGVVWDGRYVYHVPCRDTAGFHARALRYDTQADFKDATSWEAHDAAGTDGLTSVGYGGGAYDGRYVYYAPFTNETARHAEVLRYDTEGGFGESGSWAAYNAGTVDSLKLMGYVDAVFDGRYVYYSPFGYDPFAHARVLRFDTQAQFKSADSWTAFDAGQTSGLNTKGYYGLVQEGDYIYFVPFHDGGEFHARVLRYNTKGEFKSETSWAAYDASQTSGMDTRGYKMAASDGRYVYFVPFRTTTQECHGRVLRLDTQGEFADPASWTAYDAGATDGLKAQAYVGATFDGNFVYFCPYSYSAIDYHSVMLRVDTNADFSAASSWQAFNANPIDGLETKGYKGIVFDGRYIHFTPYHDGTALRFDTAYTP